MEQSDFIYDEINRDYHAALAVVAIIDRLDSTDLDFLPGEIRGRRDWIDALYRNRNHLEIMIGRYAWPAEYDLAPLRSAIAQADRKLSEMRG